MSTKNFIYRIYDSEKSVVYFGHLLIYVQRSDWKYHCEILMCDFAFIERQTKLNCEIGVIICRCEYIVCKMKSLKQFHIILKK